MRLNEFSCSPKGYELIKQFTPLRLTAYQDAYGIWTIGYLHTGPDVKSGLTITESQADQLLANDLGRYIRGVNEAATIRINQNQFDALLSFAFDLGLSTLQTSLLMRLFNESKLQSAAEQFPRWTRRGGKDVPELLARRKAEQTLFLTPV